MTQKLISLDKNVFESFLNKGKIKFLQRKQDIIRQKCCQKHEKRQCVHTHEV